MALIEVRDRVRILAEGTFHGQEVKVSKIDKTLSKTWYCCDVTLKDGTPRPSWFAASEVQIVESEKSHE